MSAYNNARRAPNVSQYIANLNQIPSGQDLTAQHNDISLDDGLDFLTNTEFFDFDQFHAPPPPFDRQAHPAATAPNNGQQFAQQFADFPQPYSDSPSSMTSPTNLQGSYPPQPTHFSSSSAASPVAGGKRKASSAMQTTADLEEASRLAAEEDKRRRNTAASARFRVKKKQREQALEKQTKEMSDKVSALESKVQRLEMENKWLKELITEKSDVKIDAALAMKSEKETEERSSESRTDGVGTATAA